jgi:arabinoxylan arabinofuranohydrolase
MYKTKYPKLNLYAYDVCNECINDGTGGPREKGDNNQQGGKSAWVQVYGDNSFIEQAFTFARKYAPSTCKLYYNDYNEFAGTKKNGIINSIIKPLKAKGLLDGMGMQSHIDASYNNAWGCTVEYLKAMDEYLALGVDVQVTELDISVDNGKYSYTQQADKYEAIFKHAMEYNAGNHGNKVSLVQIWGPNDANSWLKAGSNALLYDSNNQPKEAYKRLMNMQTSIPYDPSNPGGDDPVVEPEPNEYNWWLHYTFEDGVQGWSSRGTATVASSSQNHYTDYGSKSLSISGRDANWCGAGITLPYYIKEGESYSFSAHVKYDTGGDTDFFCMKLQYGSGDDTHYDTIAEGQAVKGEWVQLSNPSFKIPAGAGGGLLYLETHENEGTTCDFYADEVIVAVDGTSIVGEGSANIVTYSTADLDGSGTVNVGDYVIAKRLLKTGITDSKLKKAADVDQSTKFDAEDVKLIWQFITKKIKEFPKAEVDYGDYDFTGLQNKFGNVTLASSWKKDGENNPCTTQRFGADPGWMVYKGRLYLYTTADEFEYKNGQMHENSYASGYINCISTADMVNWTDHGQIPVAKTRTSGAIASWANNAWAPDAEWKTINGQDKFFLYFANNGSGIGVVTADDPTFTKNVKDPLGHELISRNTPNSNVTWLFDPGVYYDAETNTAMLAYGGGVPNGQAAQTKQGRIVQLGDDMISIKGTPFDPGTPYLFEDSSMIKIGDTWYYSFCHNWNVPGGANVNGNSFSSADIGYMTSKNPLGGYSYQGVVFKNTGTQRIDNGGNNHHSIIYFKNKLYVAYHSRQQAIRMVQTDGLKIYNDKGQTTADGNYRSTQINEATMNNGKITCSGDMKGCSQIETLDPFAKQQAETMVNQSRDISISGRGDTVVNVKKGSWLKTTGVDFKTGANTLTVKASSKNGAVIKVATGQNKEAMTYVEIPAGGQSTEITVPVINSPSGKNDLFFIFNGEADMDAWQFA